MIMTPEMANCSGTLSSQNSTYMNILKDWWSPEGGEKNGIEGIVVGIVGTVAMLGSGGNVSFGIEGIEGIVGRLGSGGSVVLGNEGDVGCRMVGRGGKGGSAIGLGKVDDGKGGKVGMTGSVGREGEAVSKSRRAAARLTSKLENDNARKRDKMKQLQEAIAECISRVWFNLMRI